MLHNGFVNLDDHQYIVDNPHVVSGLTSTNIVWAFKSGEASNWHPLTWISHMADCQMFGLNPARHHLVNLLFHIANTLLLFILLNRMTGGLWRSAFVAALFAWHPLHVESVAWASERKDVLSAFFFLLTLLAYVRFVSVKSKAFYLLALVLFACGLMSKPMVVTLPFVLLLLDFWPLRRFNLSILQPLPKLIVEKIPFFILSFAGSMVTFLVQQKAAVWKPAWDTHVANIFLSYFRYVSKLLWPIDLAVIYPLPRHWPVLPAIGAATLLLIWTALVIYRARQNPYLATGWFWFVGMLVPTIGIVQIGSAAMADRYTYIPSVGFFILATWGINGLLERQPQWKKFMPIAAVVVLVGLLGVTSVQIGYWQNSMKLFYRAAEVTTDNYVAENGLGKSFEQLGDNERALICYSNSVAIEPKFPPSQYNLAVCLLSLGHTNAALEHFRIVAQFPDSDAESDYALAVYFYRCGAVDDAEQMLRRAIVERADFADTQNFLGTILSAQGKFADALPYFAAAARLKPDSAEIRFNYALSLLDNHQFTEAEKEFLAELKLQPDDTRAHYRLAQAFAEQNRFADAIAEYDVVLKLSPDFHQAKDELNHIFIAHPELTNSAALDTTK